MASLRLLICLATLILFPFAALTAQSAASIAADEPALSKAADNKFEVSEAPSEWVLYADRESEFFFIDFASLTFHPQKIVLRNRDNRIMLTQSVSDRPVDDIFELDLSDLSAGRYQLELHSFSEIFTRTFRLN